MDRKLHDVRSGFTLLEVLVAVMIAATVLLAADVVFEQLADSRSVISRSAIEIDRERNASSTLSSWVAQADVSPRSPGAQPRSFGGDETSATFTSWCLAPGGWERECEVTLHVAKDTGDTSDTSPATIIAIASTGDSVQLTMHGTGIAIRYLLDAQGGGHWLRSWGTGPTTPLAIGVVSGADTLVLRIGARG